MIQPTSTTSRRSAASDTTVDRAEIVRALSLFCGHHGVTEIRALKCKGRYGAAFQASGYFDDFELAAACVASLDAEHSPAGFYFTFNDVNQACQSRAYNRFELRPEKTTTDADIIRRRWLFVDIDPPRPAGVSATDRERANVVSVREELFEELRTVAEPIVADSGNGFHLYIPIDYENSGEVATSVKRLLAGLAHKWPAVDAATFNAARITKLYGTFSRKGDSTPSRPWRMSRLVWVPDYLLDGWRLD